MRVLIAFAFVILFIIIACAKVKRPCLAVFSILGGGWLGIMVSIVVNIALIEISFSVEFSVHFSVFFFIVGSLILWRVNSGAYRRLEKDNETLKSLQLKRQRLSCFAGFIILMAFLVWPRNRWLFVSVGPWCKVPLYMILGAAITFALTFTIVDVINAIIGCCQASIAKSVVENTQQVHLVLLVSTSMGVLFGFTFGFLDVEDSADVRKALMQEEHYCYPMGIVLGAFAGLGNEHYRQGEDGKGEYAMVMQTEFDDDI